MSATSQTTVRDVGETARNVTGERIEALGVAGEADDGGAGTRQVETELRAQTRRGPGDHRHADPGSGRRTPEAGARRGSFARMGRAVQVGRVGHVGQVGRAVQVGQVGQASVPVPPMPR